MTIAVNGIRRAGESHTSNRGLRSFYCAAAVVNTIIICNVQYICIYAKSTNGAAGAIGVSYFWRYSCGRHLCRRAVERPQRIRRQK